MRKLAVIFTALLLFPVIYAQVHVFEGGLFKNWFTEPVESVYLVCFDGKMFRWVSYHSHTILVFLDDIKWQLEKVNKDFSDIMFIIHNHTSSMSFSPRDIQTYHRLVRRGFKGAFLLYQPTGNVIKYPR